MGGLLIYFLPIIIVLGIVTSYDDVKKGKIRNKYLIAATIVGLALHLTFLLLGIESITTLATQIVGAIAALAVAISIWYIKWWNAGDAKLFAVYFFLIPKTTFNSTYFPMQIISLLTNVVLPMGIILLIVALTMRYHKLGKAIKASLDLRKLGNLILLSLSIPMAVATISLYFGIPPDPIITIALMMLLSSLLSKYAGVWEPAVYISILLVRLIVDYNSFFALETLLKTAPILFTYYLVRYILLYLVMPDKKQKNIKHRHTFPYFSLDADRLLPFATIMFFGVLLTLLLGESCISLITHIIHQGAI